MTIPKSINREHIIMAIQKIDREGVPKRRESTRYALTYNGENYPPKYVITIANIFANGEEYSPSMFSGGDESNKFLQELGYDIVEIELKKNGTLTVNNLFEIPEIEPGNRTREYNFYKGFLRNKAVYEYLFNSKSHRWIDKHVIGLNPDESKGYQAMNILHFIGLKSIHKGIFKNFSILEAIQLLEQQSSDFGLVIESLLEYRQKNNNLETIMESAENEYIEIKSIITEVAEKIEVTETEKEQIIKSRIGQSTFKKALLNIEKKCKLCGLTHERFLVASHIKPWSQSNHQERLDVNNGLLLCPNHDALFDKGYISFNESGKIIISDSLNDATNIFLNINSNMTIKLNESQIEYMKWHRKEFFKKN